MDEPWQFYFEQLLQHGQGALGPGQLWNRDADVREAAHEAYRATVDLLVEQLEYDEEEAIELAKSFGGAVKSWLREGLFDLDELEEKLEERQALWEEKQLSSF
jgi:hypothetical protein